MQPPAAASAGLRPRRAAQPPAEPSPPRAPRHAAPLAQAQAQAQGRGQAPGPAALSAAASAAALGAVAALAACLSAAALAVLLSPDRPADRGAPLALSVVVLALGSVLLRVAVAALVPAGGQRLRRATRHLTGERAAYARTSQTLAMVDRDFTAADYEMLLDLDNNSQRLRQFLEGASKETIDRMPSYTFQKRPRAVPVSDIGRRNPAANDARPRGGDGGDDGANGGGGRGEKDGGDGDDLSMMSALSNPDAASAGSARPKGDSGDECSSETARKCTICLEPFENGMEIRILPCLHQFMADCIDPWLLQQAKCPVCKGDAIQGPDADAQLSTLLHSSPRPDL
jgi:Ring finger domain